MCTNGAPHSKFIPREEEKSETINLEFILVTMVIDAYEDRNVSTFGVPGAYLQTDLPKDKFTLLLLEGKFVYIMRDINTQYKQHIRFKDGRKIFYLRILRAIYGVIKPDTLWYELYVSILKDMGIQKILTTCV